MWVWLEQTSAPLSGMGSLWWFFSKAGTQTREEVFKLAGERVFPDNWQDLKKPLQKYIEANAVLHQGRFSTTTAEWVLRGFLAELPKLEDVQDED
tara:strand:+ start:808 stop:1092 length:285 start_codon:yes stop_codon:yes gene_type:complete